jgi:UDP-3-O-[3-hydroxymyristoyl] N-acetylglucosamine deacetylase
MRETERMDGMAFPVAADGAVSEAATAPQCTLKAAIGCVGVGLHTGQRVSLSFQPAPVDHGIVFRRVDLGIDVPARFDRVVDTRLCTVLEQDGVRVGTIEHVMAALAGCGIDNAVVELDGPEPPIFDGSAAQLVFLLDCAGKLVQDAPRNVVEVLRSVRVTDGDGFAELRPGPIGLDMALSIDFAVAAIGRQALSLHLTPRSFRNELSRARTFALMEEIDQLRAAGFAQGGSLDNAVVVDQARVLNPAGLRAPDEFVRHKLLDAVGDLALAGAPLRGRFIAHRSGHTLNNRLLRALFADQAAWRQVEPAPLAIAAE